MKFEAPIVEIQKFKLTDILTTSGVDTARVGTIAADEGYPCTGTAADMGDDDPNCI